MTSVVRNLCKFATWHGFLAIGALVLTGLSASAMWRMPAWPTAFAQQPKSASCVGQPIFDTAIVHSAAPRIAHVSSSVVLQDGRLRAFWYEGSAELKKDVRIYSAIFDGRWSEPRAIAGAVETGDAIGQYVRKLGNSVVYPDAHGDLVLLFASFSFGGWSSASLNLIRSSDEGQTWSALVHLLTTPTFNFSTLVKAPPIQMEGGLTLVPAYQEFLKHIPEVMLLDTDGRVLGRRRIGGGINPLQPQLVVLDRQRARAFVRSNKLDRVQVSDTTDAGWTWTALRPISIPNFDRPVGVISLGGERVLMVYSTPARNGAPGTRLMFAVSGDGGESWRDIYALDDLVPQTEDMSYPWITEGAGGIFHLTFTNYVSQGSQIAHVRFNRDWIAAHGGPPCP